MSTNTKTTEKKTLLLHWYMQRKWLHNQQLYQHINNLGIPEKELSESNLVSNLFVQTTNSETPQYRPEAT